MCWAVGRWAFACAAIRCKDPKELSARESVACSCWEARTGGVTTGRDPFPEHLACVVMNSDRLSDTATFDEHLKPRPVYCLRLRVTISVTRRPEPRSTATAA